MKADMLVKVKGKLIVSCQALENEPLHSAWSLPYANATRSCY